MVHLFDGLNVLLIQLYIYIGTMNMEGLWSYSPNIFPKIYLLCHTFGDTTIVIVFVVTLSIITIRS